RECRDGLDSVVAPDDAVKGAICNCERGGQEQVAPADVKDAVRRRVLERVDSLDQRIPDQENDLEREEKRAQRQRRCDGARVVGGDGTRGVGAGGGFAKEICGQGGRRLRWGQQRTRRRPLVRQRTCQRTVLPPYTLNFITH